MKKEERSRNLIETAIRVVSLFGELEKKPRRFGTNELLYTSEIHTLETIGSYKGLNLTELAKIKGITKGAVSQMVEKLRRKGFVNKEKEKGNNKEIIITLSTKGEIAYHQHKLFHLKLDIDFVKYFNSLPDEKLSVMEEFFDVMENFLKRASKEF